LNAGKYYITVTDAKGCIVSDSVTLTQPKPIQVTLSASDTSLCQGQPVQLFCGASGGNPKYEYHWSTGLVGPGPITQSPTQTTIYSVYVIDSSGCISPTSFLTITLTAPITVTATNVEACDGQPVTIRALASGGTGGPYNYTWSNGFIGPTQSVTILLSGSPQTFTVTVGDGCSSLTTTNVVVTAHPLASGTMILSDTVGCQPLTVHFTGNSDIGTTYTWNFGDGTPLVKDSIVSHTYPFAGTDTVTLTITTQYGCQTVLSKRPVITVYPTPVADFSVSPSVDPLPNATTVYFTNLSKGATSYIWNFDDGNSSNEINPQHFYALSGDYVMTLIALNTLGCADTFSITTISENYIHFANAFTPNPLGGNGGTYNYTDLNNDVFFPTSLGVAEYHLLIFNKWGELIFESYDIKKGWDGYYKGSLCEQDVYVWKAFATFRDGSKFAQTGDVTLLR
jgi:PKD repeat protein